MSYQETHSSWQLVSELHVSFQREQEENKMDKKMTGRKGRAQSQGSHCSSAVCWEECLCDLKAFLGVPLTLKNQGVFWVFLGPLWLWDRGIQRNWEPGQLTRTEDNGFWLLRKDLKRVISPEYKCNHLSFGYYHLTGVRKRNHGARFCRSLKTEIGVCKAHFYFLSS